MAGLSCVKILDVVQNTRGPTDSDRPTKTSASKAASRRGYKLARLPAVYPRCRLVTHESEPQGWARGFGANIKASGMMFSHHAVCPCPFDGYTITSRSCGTDFRMFKSLKPALGPLSTAAGKHQAQIKHPSPGSRLSTPWLSSVRFDRLFSPPFDPSPSVATAAPPPTLRKAGPAPPLSRVLAVESAAPLPSVSLMTATTLQSTICLRSSP